jgi:hypothetical protein
MQATASQPRTPSEKRYLRWGVRVVVISALPILAVTVFGAGQLLPDGLARIDDLLAMIAAFLWLQAAVLMTILFAAAPRNADWPRRRLSAVLAAAASAAVLFLPMAGQGWIDPRLNFAIVLVLIAAYFWFVWRTRRDADELDRTLQKQTYEANYWVLFTGLAVYAAGERLGLLTGATAWGVLAFAMLSSVAIRIWFAVRLGMVQAPRDD